MNIKTFVYTFLCVTSLIISSHSFARSGTSLTLFELAEQADAVVDAVVVKVTNHKARGSWKDEPYSVLHLEGSSIGSSGERPINGRYLLRVPVIENSDVILESRFLFFISRNGEQHKPFVKGDMRAGLISIDSDGYLLGAKNIRYTDIDREGSLVFAKRFNSCTIDDAPDLYGDEKNEDDVVIREYSREELLANLNSFECPDGSQWWRGNDKPRDYVQKSPITVDEVKSRISEHLAAQGIHQGDLSKFNKLPPGKVLNLKNSLEFLEASDRTFVDLMKQVEGYAETFSDQSLVDMYEREKIRGREKNFPKNALRIVNESKRNNVENKKGD